MRPGSPRTSSKTGASFSALAVNPDYLPAIQGWARLSVALRHEPDEPRQRLELITLRGDRDWREWARERLAR